MRAGRIGWMTFLLLAMAAAAYRAAAVEASADLRPRVLQYWQAWQRGPDAAAPLYAKESDLVFFDVVPLKYTGWNDYEKGVGPNLLAKFTSVSFTVNDDVRTTVRGHIAWTSATVQADGVAASGAPIHLVLRHTAIWEQRGHDWVIVHEHVSVPASLGG